MRLFYGIELPDGIRSHLAGVQKELRTAGVEAGNWSDSSLFHITLLFLGELDEAYRPKLEALGHKVARGASPFPLHLSSVGCFERNRILWYGLQHDQGYEQLAAFYRELREGAKAFFPGELESRPYKAHITLARKAQPSGFPLLRNLATEKADAVDNSFLVPHICLFASMRINGKLQYPVLSRFELPAPNDFVPNQAPI